MKIKKSARLKVGLISCKSSFLLLRFPVRQHVHNQIRICRVIRFEMNPEDDALARLHEPFKMLRSREKYSSLESESAAHYFASALMGILVWWVEREMPCKAEKIDKLFRQLAIPSLRHDLVADEGT